MALIMTMLLLAGAPPIRIAWDQTLLHIWQQLNGHWRKQLLGTILKTFLAQLALQQQQTIDTSGTCVIKLNGIQMVILLG